MLPSDNDEREIGLVIKMLIGSAVDVDQRIKRLK